MYNCIPWQKLIHEAEKNHWWYKSRRTIVNNIFWKKFFSPNKATKILSVGTGSGIELSYLSQFGATEGMDIDENHVKLGRERGFLIHHQDITQCTLPSESYDIIFAMDVLEHIEEDKKAYEAIVRLLKPGGMLVATVPAYQFLWSKSDEFNFHKRRYNKAQFRSLLTHELATIKTCSYYNCFLFPILLFRRFLFPTGGEREIKVPNKMLNKILYFIFQSEKYWLRYFSFPYGGSLIAVIQKKK